jgi:D-lactate dehydrogenase (cytochrome)
LWTARHKLYYASLNLRPGCRSVITDVCVPISLLPEMIDATSKDFAEAGISGTVHLSLKYHIIVVNPNIPKNVRTDEEQSTGNNLFARLYNYFEVSF